MTRSRSRQRHARKVAARQRSVRVVIAFALLAAGGTAFLVASRGLPPTSRPPTSALGVPSTAPGPTADLGTASTVALSTRASDASPPLVQTSAEPPSSNAALRARLTPLWRAIQRDAVPTGLTVFFPEAAYVRMKSGEIPDPSSDYVDRLVAFYRLDLGAYRLAIGSDPSRVRLLAVDGNPADAAWIAPGVCENSVGYWHLPGVRLVYSTPAATRSFAVASMISWRGVWYIVHLGPNPRPVDVGTVDQPAVGAGTPGPPGGC